MIAANDKIHDKLDQVLEGQGGVNTRVAVLETVVKPLTGKVDGNSRAIQKAYGAIAVVVLVFGGIGAASSLGWI